MDNRADLLSMIRGIYRADDEGLLYEFLLELFPLQDETMQQRVREALYEWDM